LFQITTQSLLFCFQKLRHYFWVGNKRYFLSHWPC